MLANPGDKGESGPGPTLNPSGIVLPSSRPASENTRDFIDYKFSVTLRNTGDKTIVLVKWAYFFEPKNTTSEGLSYLFTAKLNLAPGKEKTLNDSLNASGRSASSKLPGKHNQALYNERVAILRIEYADGTSWENAAPARGN